MIYTLRTITPPAIEPVTVAECKLDSRVDGDEFDTLLPSLIAAAREMCENVTGRRLITQTVRVTANGWPVSGNLFALAPVQSAVVTYWDGSTWATHDSDEYAIGSDLDALHLLPADGMSWPTLGSWSGERVRIDAVVGYGDAAEDVPASLRMWIRQHVAAMLQAPTGHSDKVSALPWLDHLLNPYRVWGV